MKLLTLQSTSTIQAPSPSNLQGLIDRTLKPDYHLLSSSRMSTVKMTQVNYNS